VSVSKDTIAAAFERHVERFGYQKTTLDEIAAELHISKKTIYTVFESKREIYAYVVERQAARERIRMGAAVAGLPTYAEKLEALVRMTLGLSRAHIVETTEAEWMQEYEIAGDAFRKATSDLLAELYEKGVAEGEFAPGNSELVVRMMGAMVIEYVLMVRANPELDLDEALVTRILQFVG